MSQTVVATMIGPVGDQPWHFAVDPMGGFVYTCDSASDQISIISTATDTVTGTIPLTMSPRNAVVF